MAAQNQYMVMGHDVRDLGRLWLAAWRDLIWGDDSPLRVALEEPVAVELPNGETQCFQGAAQCIGAHTTFSALAIPDELVLARELTLPPLPAADLEAAVALEVNACSPFALDDTAVGKRVIPTDSGYRVAVAIASRAAISRYLSANYSDHNMESRELWAPCGDDWLVLKGFGEAARQQAYWQRLLRVTGFAVGSLVLCLLLLGALTLLNSGELSRLEALQMEASDASKTAIVARDELANINATIAELNTLTQALPSPSVELAVLSGLLPDTAYITQFSQDGRNIRIQGRAKDAATLQKLLTENPRYAQVSAPQAIRQVGREGLEQFSLDLELGVSP